MKKKKKTLERATHEIRQFLTRQGLCANWWPVRNLKKNDLFYFRY